MTNECAIFSSWKFLSFILPLAFSTQCTAIELHTKIHPVSVNSISEENAHASKQLKFKQMHLLLVNDNLSCCLFVKPWIIFTHTPTNTHIYFSNNESTFWLWHATKILTRNIIKSHSWTFAVSFDCICNASNTWRNQCLFDC